MCPYDIPMEAPGQAMSLSWCASPVAQSVYVNSSLTAWVAHSLE